MNYGIVENRFDEKRIKREAKIFIKKYLAEKFYR